jgi:hypothetical protein
MFVDLFDFVCFTFDFWQIFVVDLFTTENNALLIYLPFYVSLIMSSSQVPNNFMQIKCSLHLSNWLIHNVYIHAYLSSIQFYLK